MKELSDLIYQYSVKIAELQNSQPILNQTQLDKIIQNEFQLSSQELQLINQEFEHSLEAGYNFLREENYDRAAQYFHEALKLQPFNLTVLKGLLKANQALFVETGSVEYKFQLEENCEKIISIDPSDSEAARTITKIERFEKAEKGTLIKVSIAGVCIFFLFLFAIFSFWTIYILMFILIPGAYGAHSIMEYFNLRRLIFDGDNEIRTISY